MAGLMLDSTQAVLEGSTRLAVAAGGKTVGSSGSRPSSTVVQVRAAAGEASAAGRRAALIGLVGTSLAAGPFAGAVLADPRSIKVGAPPAPSGGLSGTKNSDEARDVELPLAERFYLQPLTPEKAAARAKESAGDILKVKELIDRKAWPYVQNDLRLKASYLRYDLRTILSSKPKDEKAALKQLSDAVFSTITDLDHAAKIKSGAEAEKSYAASKSAIEDLLSKLG